MVDNQGSSLDELTSDECYALLKTRILGRLGVIIDNYPLIIPVNYAMDGFNVVFRSRPGSKLIAAQHKNVTFQIDDFNHADNTGWSVLVRGQAEELSEDHSEAIRQSTESTGVQPWAPGEDFRWVRIISHGVSGRRITPRHIHEWRLGAAAYM
jgi:nitroimidazol reductase NimA-like FMN-containing flavoprotein (pyridoxamine 5'-phosphate oxidase superfamily)